MSKRLGAYQPKEALKQLHRAIDRTASELQGAGWIKPHDPYMKALYGLKAKFRALEAIYDGQLEIDFFAEENPDLID